MQPEDLEFWIYNNLPPKLADWLNNDFNVEAKSFQELGFQASEDVEVFRIAASNPNTIVITTKDIDFVTISDNTGELPKVLYLNVGNISNKRLKEIIYRYFSDVIRIFSETNTFLVEITT